jgi:hypothetical protein
LRQATGLIQAGLELKDIISAILAFVKVPPIRQDISNLIQSIQNVELNSNTLINALLKTLDAQGWVHEHELDKETGRLKRLFLASKECLAYAKKHLDILIINATYKTNRFEMLLLNIISKLLYSIQILF